MTAPLFTFAVIADTHLNPEEARSGSPWRSNALANARARWAVAALNADAPDFVIHLGDMVHPVPAQAAYGEAADRFREIFGHLDAPLHVLPGNHDIGDKPADWMPAEVVAAPALDVYRRTFGDLWHAFDRDGCRFILHCNPILGTGLPEDDAQWDWLEAELAGAGGKRVFFLTHYPLFLTDPDEPEHYDNLAPEPRERLRRLLIVHGVEAVFAGHVHTIFHTRLDPAPDAPFQHVAPCLSAIRLDYSHLFKSPPLPKMEHGRNDAQKLGYYLVDVLPEGYRIRLRRTEGAALPPSQANFDPGPLPLHAGRLSERPLGVDLRQGWAQRLAIPHTGVVDEFRRKYVRNDYLLTAVQQAGLRDLRVPLDDLLDPDIRARMRDFHALGHRFQVFAIDPPPPGLAELVAEMPGLVTRFEVIARSGALATRVAEWKAVAGRAGIPVYAAPMWTSADLAAEAVSFTHVIGHGFLSGDAEGMRAADAFSDGTVMRIGPDDDPAEALANVPRDLAGGLVIYLCLGAPNPAVAADDDTAQTARIFATLGTMKDLPAGTILMLDTLEDFDRGYFPRNGLYDARFNPRDAARRLSRTELP